MKTLFIVSEKRVNDHVGEEYDYILEVDDQPTTENIEELANRVRTRIRSLWMEQKEDGGDEPKVVCTLDAASPYNAMLIDLQLILKEQEGIIIDLPYLEGMRQGTEDPETIQLLDQMDNNRQEG